MAERKAIYLDDAMDALRKAMHADIDHMAAMICDDIEDVFAIRRPRSGNSKSIGRVQSENRDGRDPHYAQKRHEGMG